MFKKFIVGIDFSPASERAAEAAADLARSTGGEVVLVHVMVPGETHADPERIFESVRPRLEIQLRNMASGLSQRHGIKVDWGIVEGTPAQELVTFVERWGGDMIVVGSEGRSGLPRMLLGSVPDRVERLAPVPVMIVGRSARWSHAES